jgi:hypothetical protein
MRVGCGRRAAGLGICARNALVEDGGVLVALESVCGEGDDLTRGAGRQLAGAVFGKGALARGKVDTERLFGVGFCGAFALHHHAAAFHAAAVLHASANLHAPATLHAIDTLQAATLHVIAAMHAAAKHGIATLHAAAAIQAAATMHAPAT